MAERYSRIFELPRCQYADSSPVILEAGALLKDSKSGNMLAQLKFRNVSILGIKMLRIAVIPLDAMGRELGEPVHHTYLDLTAQRDSEFGSREAISLPDSSVRSFRVRILEIGFADNSISEKVTADWKVLPSPSPLLSALGDSELVKQYQLTHGKSCQYITSRFGSLWRCSCGALNLSTEESCHICGNAFLEITEAELQELSADRDQRLEEEKAKKEAEEKRHKEEEEEAERLRVERKAEETARHKKQLRISFAAAAAVLAVFAVIMLIKNVIIPNNQYKNARSLMDAGQYEEAIAAFEALNGYQDSASQIESCRIHIKDLAYNEAIALKNAGQYEDAIAAFNALGDYSDSETQILECRYLIAVALKDSGDIVNAYHAFTDLDGYRDSSSLLKELKAPYEIEQIRMATPGKSVFFGQFYYAYNGGFKDTEWTVIAKEGGKALLISRYVLAVGSYGYKVRDWEHCPVREWLNTEFLRTAFSSDEKSYILETLVETQNSAAVMDYVFLLSISDIMRGGIGMYRNKFDMDLQLTPYVKNGGFGKMSLNKYDYHYYCLLRDGAMSGNDYSGLMESSAQTTSSNPCLYSDDFGIRPVIWVDIS